MGIYLVCWTHKGCTLQRISFGGAQWRDVTVILQFLGWDQVYSVSMVSGALYIYLQRYTKSVFRFCGNLYSILLCTLLWSNKGSHWTSNGNSNFGLICCLLIHQVPTCILAVIVMYSKSTAMDSLNKSIGRMYWIREYGRKSFNEVPCRMETPIKLIQNILKNLWWLSLHEIWDILQGDKVQSSLKPHKGCKKFTFKRGTAPIQIQIPYYN